jgi:pimeloyl-ACP methyl ester carboxylesterase
VASVVLRNPLNRRRGVPLSPKQFRYGFANAISEQEAADLYEHFSVAGSGVPLFQAALANLNPWTEAKVNTKNPNRGPLLIVSGERDHTVPGAIARASYKRQRRNPSPTELMPIPNRGHSLTIDAGWSQVADAALEFLIRYAPAADHTRGPRPPDVVPATSFGSPSPTTAGTATVDGLTVHNRPGQR